VRIVDRHLEHSSGAGSMAREIVLELLAQHPTTDELRHDAALVVYELVSNAVEHGRPDVNGMVHLTCELDEDFLVVRVRDAGTPSTVQSRAAETIEAGGRGLALVEALSSTWSVDRTDGTVVTARVPLTWRR
jgi:anti-sigma regulatory factor (Ser/Thr protein kinase)